MQRMTDRSNAQPFLRFALHGRTLREVGPDGTERAIHTGQVSVMNYGDYDVDVCIGIGDEVPEAVIEHVTFRRRDVPITRRGIRDYRLGVVLREAMLCASMAQFAHREVEPVDDMFEKAKRLRPTPINAIGDDELRAISEAYVSVGNRKRYDAIRRAYVTDDRLKDLVSSREPSALRRRVSLCRQRTDPTTGKPFLADGSDGPYIPRRDD